MQGGSDGVESDHQLEQPYRYDKKSEAITETKLWSIEHT